jgi:hypothetical protein
MPARFLAPVHAIALARTAVLIPLAALALAGCASGRASLGNINLRPYGDPGRVQTTFGVQEGRIVSPNLDLVVEPDGCMRGSLVNNLVQLCKQPSARPPEKAGDLVERWSGTGGDFTLQLMEGGRELRADGYLRAAQGTLPLHTTIPLGQGPQWDELRKHPALLAVAAAATGVLGEPDQDAAARGR